MHFKQSVCFPFSALYLDFMLQMVDEVHLQYYLLSSDEVWRDIKGQGKVFGHTQLCVQEKEINNMAERDPVKWVTGVLLVVLQRWTNIILLVPLWYICSRFFAPQDLLISSKDKSCTAEMPYTKLTHGL